MITVTKQEILDFIKAQPDDRQVDMRNNMSIEECGCVMVHYGKEVLNIEDEFGCGCHTWEREIDKFSPCASMDFDISEISRLNFKGTYGDLKTRIQLSHHEN